jgi:hypothetical protein
LLTEFGAESGEMNDTKVVDNFDIFLEIINKPSYYQRFRKYDQCKLGGSAGTQFWTDQVIWTSLEFKATSKGNL